MQSIRLDLSISFIAFVSSKSRNNLNYMNDIDAICSEVRWGGGMGCERYQRPQKKPQSSIYFLS